MPSSTHPVERFSFSTALFGMLVLTLGMGLGRFLYTPMLPVMMAEGSFSFSQLSWIASGNYAGYLAGSLLFSFGAFHQPSRLRPLLLVSALASGLLILAMAWLPPLILVLLESGKTNDSGRTRLRRRRDKSCLFSRCFKMLSGT